MTTAITDILGGSVKLSICLLFLALLSDVSGVTSNAVKKCNQVTCEKFQYCADLEGHCKQCKDICDLQSHNRQPDECEKECQDYMMDISTSAMDRKIQLATTLAEGALAVSSLVLVLFVGYFVAKHIIKKGILQSIKKKKQMSDKFDVETTKNGFKVDDLKLDMASAQAQVPIPPRSSSPSQCPVTPATTSTPLSRPRHPSEDATLEYAYDNPALAPSPVLDKDVAQEVQTRKESSF